jgi:thiamine-phosphate pyrophosphorylase
MKRYYITDRKSAGGLGALLEIIRAQLHLGVDIIQIREKDLPVRQLFEFTLAVLQARQAQTSAPVSTKIMVNTRADIALATGADGVHLPASAPRETLPGLLVARSCHTLEEVRQARASFVTFSPVFETPGKSPARGLAALKAACQLGKPVFALGGVTWENAQDCIWAGAQGIAGIRLFQKPKL